MRRAAAGVAVHLRQDDAVEFQGVVEGLGAVDRVLTGHGVADHVDLIGPHQAVDLLQLVHRHFVDVEPTGGVEDHRVEQRGLGVGDGVTADVYRRGRRRLAEDGHADLFAEDLDLIDGGGALHVGRDQQRLAAALAQHQGELAGRGGLTLALEAAEHQDGRPVLGEGDIRIDRSHQLNKFVVDNFDDLLAGVEGAEHLLADGSLRDLGDEVLGDGVVDVGFEEGSCAPPAWPHGRWLP